MTQILPPWFSAAAREIGIRELPENRGPAIARYIALAHCGGQGDPWCAIFANAMFATVKIPGTKSAMARAFEHSENFVKLKEPALGCVVTFWRGKKSQGFGHVGFYNGELGDYISTLGGNEGDMVKVEMYRRNSSAFGLSGYYWPKGVPVINSGVCKPYLANGAPTKSGGKVT